MNNKIENSRILVTGGAGFIGSNLIETFLKQDNEVVSLDNFSTGKKQNIAEFLKNKNFRLIEGDIRNLTTCKQSCDNIDYVFHQAAVGSVLRSVEDPATSAEINIMGTLNMLVSARDCKVKRFIYASSSSTYGDSKVLPKKEGEIGSPLSPYAITKYTNELYAENFFKIYGLESIGLRYFNVFGERQDPLGAYAAVIPKFIISLIKHERPIINGDGSYSRDFTYINNIIHANELAALTPFSKILKDNLQPSTIFNIAYGEKTTLNELFFILRKKLIEFDKKIADINPVYGPERKADIPHSLADITKAKEILGYSPKHNVVNGLALTSEWYWDNRK